MNKHNFITEEAIIIRSIILNSLKRVIVKTIMARDSSTFKYSEIVIENKCTDRF